MRVRPDITRRGHKSRGSRKRRRWLAVFAAPVAITTMAVLGPTGSVSVASARTAADVINVTIHLTNASSYCADVKDSVNQPGTRIWLYKCALGGSEHWYQHSPVQCATGGQFICSVFVDVKNTSVCLGMDGARHVLLQGCSAGYTTAEEWIKHTGPENGWRNEFWDGNGDLAVASDTQGDLLYGVNASNGCGGCWFRWTAVG
jgi:hypothetical protein